MLKYKKRYYLSKQLHSLTVSLPLEYVHLKEELEQDPSSLIVFVPLQVKRTVTVSFSLLCCYF